MTIVPNSFPTISSPRRIAIIGEAPGNDETHEGRPFVGQAGKMLDSQLSSVGILRSTCFIGNVSQVRPENNDIKKAKKEDLEAGKIQLGKDLDQFNPNLCVLMGRTALAAAREKSSLDLWRGSCFISETPTFLGRKCLATYHPSACLRDYSLNPIVMSDLRKAMEEGLSPTWEPPKRILIANHSFEELIEELRTDIVFKPKLACDIEGIPYQISCIGFADRPERAYVVPFLDLENKPVWNPSQTEHLWYLVRQILEDPQIPKVWQNGLYDRFVLKISKGINVQGNKDDILLKFWEVYAELKKSLAFQASILTREPYYKADRKTTDQLTFYRYNAMDACVTFECNEKLEGLLPARSRVHYEENHSLLDVFLYMQLRGMRYDVEEAARRLVQCEEHIAFAQSKLDAEASKLGTLNSVNFADKPSLLPLLQSFTCHKVKLKKGKDVPNKDWVELYPRLKEALLSRDLTPTEQWEMSVACGATMNIRSPKFKDFLYGTCKLPTQWKKDLATGELRPTTDYLSLLRLSKSHSHPALVVSLELSQLRTRAQMLSWKTLKGRIHASYGICGTETGRISCSKSMLTNGDQRIGSNLQTVPDDWVTEDEEDFMAQGMRDLFLADEGCYLGKVDLKGADGWTIGSYLAMLGDHTMLEDLKFGLKPAQIVAYVIRHGGSEVQRLRHDRPALMALVQSQIKKEDWEYFCAKILTWGGFYLMGPILAADKVFLESGGKHNLSSKEAKVFLQACSVRYDAARLHNWMKDHLTSQPYPAKLTASNGFTRRFFGRNHKWNCEILGDALAHLPQVYTTHATKLAIKRLWNDPDNRVTEEILSTTETVGTAGSLQQGTQQRDLCGQRSNGLLASHDQRMPSIGSLRVEPLHQVHDEGVFQWKIEDTPWAIAKLREWFNNEIEIAGQRVTIPFEGSYGLNWAMDEKGKVGTI